MLTKKLENAVQKVVDTCKEDESPVDAALWAINEITIQVADTHIEMIGLLEEAKLTVRQNSLEILEEESKKESGVAE